MEEQVKHPETVTGYPGSLRDLAKQVGNMRYDKLAEFIGLLSEDLKAQSKADAKRPSVANPAKTRLRLAAALKNTSLLLDQASAGANEAWEISKKFM